MADAIEEITILEYIFASAIASLIFVYFPFAVHRYYWVNQKKPGYIVLFFLWFFFIIFYPAYYYINNYLDKNSGLQINDTQMQEVTRISPAQLSIEIKVNYDTETKKFSNKGLPINLRKQEFIIFNEYSNYYEIRSQYQSGYRGHGISIPGSSINSWSKIDYGVIILTNKRLYFAGRNKKRDYKLEELLSQQIFYAKHGFIFKKKIPEGVIFDTSKFARKHLYDISNPVYFLTLFHQIDEIERNLFSQIASPITTKTDNLTKCVACDYEAEGEYCLNCGVSKIQSKCPHCHNVTNLKFCQKCGTQLNQQESKVQPEWSNLSGDDFEKYISELLIKMGYFEVNNRSLVGDGGIDIEAVEKGKLTTSRIGIECKNWPEGTVGREVVQKLDSALRHENFTKGIVISSGRFSNGAIEYARNKNITLIGGEKLNKLVSEYMITK